MPERPASDARLVLAADLDGTMAGGTAEDRAQLTALLSAQRATTLLYVTGRTAAGARSIIARTELPVPDILIADVGTSVLHGVGPRRATEVEAVLEPDWPGANVVRRRLADCAVLTPQDIDAPRRVSYWVAAVRRRRAAVARVAEGEQYDPFHARAPDDVSFDAQSADLAEQAAAAAVAALDGLGTDVVVSANVFLDVLPRGVNKGTTLQLVLRWLGLEDAGCIVAGDSLNDLALFETGLPGIVVGNCEPGLSQRVADMGHVYRARGAGAAGVLEGLRHHGYFRLSRRGRGE